MCYQVVERYSACGCLYHQHAIDPCQSYNQKNHDIQEKTVLVGYICPQHSLRGPRGQSSLQNRNQRPDSSYSSGERAFRSTTDYCLWRQLFKTTPKRNSSRARPGGSQTTQMDFSMDGMATSWGRTSFTCLTFTLVVLGYNQPTFPFST